MPINPQYGMGTYNARLPSVNIRLPQTAGGVATPLAFFPSTQRGDVTEALDTSLSDLIAGYGESKGMAGDGSSGSSGVSGGKAGGLGLGGTAAKAVGKAAEFGLALAGAPKAVSSVAGGVTTGLVGKGISAQDITNVAFNTLAVALGVPGMAMAALGALGFNPTQGIAELLGISDVTPGFEGGFFGTPGVGTGVTAAPGEGIGGFGVQGSTPGYGTSDLGSGIGTTGIGLGTEQGGLQGAMSGTFGGIGDFGSSTSSNTSDPPSEAEGEE